MINAAEPAFQQRRINSQAVNNRDVFDAKMTFQQARLGQREEFTNYTIGGIVRVVGIGPWAVKTAQLPPQSSWPARSLWKT